MEQMTITKLSTLEIRLNEVQDFSLIKGCENRFALLGSTTSVTTGEMIFENCSTSTFPYILATAPISQERVADDVLSAVDMADLFESGNVFDCQELTLEPLFTLEYSESNVPARLLQVDWSPHPSQLMLAMLTTYGACNVYIKQPRARYWCDVRANITDALQTTVIETIELPTIRSRFKDLINFTNELLITAFSWDPSEELQKQQKYLIYVSTAASKIYAYSFDHDTKSALQFYVKFETELKRINYIKCLDYNWLLVSDISGVVQLLRVDHDDEPKISMHATLWGQLDHMSCQQALFTKSESYLYILFSKAANIIVYCLERETGVIKKRLRTAVDGIKITCMEILSTMEFLIGTVCCELFHLKLHHEEDTGKLECTIKEVILKGVKVETMQIKGLSVSEHGNLCSMLMSRNCEMGTKHADLWSYVCIFQMKSHNVIEILERPLRGTLDAYMDYAVELRLRICNKIDLASVYDYMRLSHIIFPTDFSEEFLRKLQIKYMLYVCLQFAERTTIRSFGGLVQEENFVFVLNMLKFVAYSLRLQYLSTFEDLNCFQAKVAAYLISACQLISEDLFKETENPENLQSGQIKKFLDSINDNIYLTHMELQDKIKDVNTDDKCVYCDKDIDLKALKCENGHEVRRCCISYMQIPLENERYCPQCNVAALDSDEKLKQILRPDETIHCTQCRFAFTTFEF